MGIGLSCCPNHALGAGKKIARQDNIKEDTGNGHKGDGENPREPPGGVCFFFKKQKQNAQNGEGIGSDKK